MRWRVHCVCQVHNWVNYQSMLGKCLVGRYVPTPAAVLALEQGRLLVKPPGWSPILGILTRVSLFVIEILYSLQKSY